MLRSVPSETVQKKGTLPSTREIIRVDSWLLYKRRITHHFVTSSEDPFYGLSPVFSQPPQHRKSSARSKSSAWQINRQHLLNYSSSNYLASLIAPAHARQISRRFAVKV